MDYALRARDLSKDYKNFPALNHCSMNVPKGSIYGFVGENGAGKTTLIRIVCALQKASGGHIELFGVGDDSPDIVYERKRMGAIVESPALFPDLSARENLEAQAALLEVDEFDPDAILALVGLSDTGPKKAKHFSLGMRQRLAIGMALTGQPDLILLDEPVNGLDPQGIIDLRELILKLNQEHQITFLISSHYLSELARLATHYGFIRQGKILAEVSSKELLEKVRPGFVLRIRTETQPALMAWLDQQKMPFQVLDAHSLQVESDLKSAELSLMLARAGILLEGIQEKGQDLESLYLQIMKGGRL